MNCMPDGRYDGRISCPLVPCVPCVLGKQGKFFSRPADPGELSPAPVLPNVKVCRECDQEYSRPPTIKGAQWKARRYCSHSCSSSANVRERWARRKAVTR